MKKILLLFICLNLCGVAHANDLEDLVGSKEVLDSVRDTASLNLFFKVNKVSKEFVNPLVVTDEEIIIDVKRNREVRVVQLSNPEVRALNSITLTISMPVERPEGARYPVVYMLPGLYSEKDITSYVQNVGNTIVVSYQYAFGNLNPALVTKVNNVGRNILAVPAQVSASMKWLKDQTWVDPTRVSLMGVSLGGVFLPLCQRFMNSQGISVYSSVIAYAGTDLQEIFSHSVESRMGSKESKVAMNVLKVFFTPLEPKTHLPYLTGKFLVIYGNEDGYMAPDNSIALYNLLPGSKDLIGLAGGHINSKKPEAISLLNEAAFGWLQQIGAAN